MDNITRLDPDTAWAAFMRRDRELGRAGHRRGQNHRHLLQAELPGAPPQARARHFLRVGEEARARGFRAVPALQARRGRPRPRGGGEGGEDHRAPRRRRG